MQEVLGADPLSLIHHHLADRMRRCVPDQVQVEGSAQVDDLSIVFVVELQYVPVVSIRGKSNLSGWACLIFRNAESVIPGTTCFFSTVVAVVDVIHVLNSFGTKDES